jgi:hypothetical protein
MQYFAPVSKGAEHFRQTGRGAATRCTRDPQAVQKFAAASTSAPQLAQFMVQLST